MPNQYTKVLTELRELYRYPRSNSKDMYSRDIRHVAVNGMDNMPDTQRGRAVAMILAGLSRQIKRNEEIEINKAFVLIALDTIGLVTILDWRTVNQIDTAHWVETECNCELPDNNPHCEAEFHNF